MDIEDIKYTYKSLGATKRVLIAIALAMILPIVLWVKLDADIGLAMDTAKRERDASKEKFDKAKKAQSDLPRLQALVADTEDQLKTVKKLLPDKVEQDKILHRVGEIARETSVDIIVYDPVGEMQVDKKVLYKERYADMEVSGHFHDVVRFYDRILHEDTLMHLRGLHMKGETVNFEAAKLLTMSPVERQRELERHTIVHTKFQLVLFRSIPPDEAASDAEKMARLEKDPEYQQKMQEWRKGKKKEAAKG